jgi:hypothetical protein
MSVQPWLVTAALLAAPTLAAAEIVAEPPAEPALPADPGTGVPVMLQPPAAPPRPMIRHGLFLGGGLFGGNISCDGPNCGGFRKAGGGELHIGWMVTPRLGVLLDGWAMTSTQNNVDISYITSTIDVRYYLLPVLWVQGGLGSGHARVSIGALAARGDNVPVGLLAAGFEVVRSRHWAIDVSAKVAQGSSTNDNGGVTTGRSAGVGAHFTWFSTGP